jgi:DNA-directed RNA polymerase subunit RPC12/RpoP
MSLKLTEYVCPKCGKPLYTREGTDIEVQFCLECGYSRWRGFCSKLKKMIWTPDDCRGCQYFFEWSNIHAWGCGYPELEG